MKPESLKTLVLEGKPRDLDLEAQLRGPLEQFRRVIPDTVGAVAQVVVDNPGQVALVAAGSMVAAKMAFNLMKPRTAGEALALFVVLQVALPKLAWAAIEKGWITFRVRDDNGCLIPLEVSK